MKTVAETACPAQSQRWFAWFRWYCIRYAAKHFHAVRLSRSSYPIPSTHGQPLIFVMNHPSWWDAIFAVILSNRFDDYRHFGPIDEKMLAKYRIFRRLGFFGIEATPRGAVRFLQTAQVIFEKPHRALWITAQGRFVDPRQRPIELRPGVGHVASRLRDGFVIPVAIEYPFWEERTPEALIRFGEPLALAPEAALNGREWTKKIEEALTAAQDVLAIEAMQRQPATFETLISGRVGVGGIYDCGRRLKSWLKGERFEAGHGEPSDVSL